MELANAYEAKALQGPADLDEVIDQVGDEAPLYRDHAGVDLQHTWVEEDGSFRYNGSAARLTRHSLGQLCSRMKLPDGGSVPAGYLARCPSELAAQNLNHWIRQLPQGEDVRALVRCRESGAGRSETVRAVLSPRYAFADHLDLLLALREGLGEVPGHAFRLAAWSLDDFRMTLRLHLDGENPATLDDLLRIGVHLSNSEVGLGSISIQGLITRLVCSNGLVVKVAELGIVQRRHVGRAGESLDALVREGLPRVLAGVREAARRFVLLKDKPVDGPIEEYLEKTARRFDLPEAVVPKALSSLEGETLYDLVNAFTRAAQGFPVAERLQVETAMSAFLKGGDP